MFIVMFDWLWLGESEGRRCLFLLVWREFCGCNVVFRSLKIGVEICLKCDLFCIRWWFLFLFLCWWEWVLFWVNGEIIDLKNKNYGGMMRDIILDFCDKYEL